MTAETFVGFLESVRPRGAGRWSARCPAHADNSPSLSVTEGERGILLKCWAGCTLEEITGKLGLRVTDLFFDAGLSDSEQRRLAKQKRAQERVAQAAAYEAKGRRIDTLREAEYVVRSAKAISITGWSDAKLDAMLNTLADAYERLWEDSDEWC